MDDPRKMRMEMRRQGIAEGKKLFDGMQIMARIVDAETDHPLLEFNKEKLANLSRIDFIVVVGPSGAGKSTLVDVAREWAQSNEGVSGHFVVPKRIVTRPQRLGDNLEENRFAPTPQEFGKMTTGGIQWDRQMDGGRVERYGFEPVPKNAIPIYSANNAFLSPEAHLSGVPTDFNERALIFCVYAFPWIRSKRIKERSPDFTLDEVELRLADMPKYVIEHSHITLRTRSYKKERSLSEDVMRMMLDTIAEIKKTGESRV